MISGEVTGDKEVARRFRALPDGVRGKVVDQVRRLTLLLQISVKKDKLSGQVLNVRTGTLRRSIDQQLLTGGDDITGIVSTNLKYARAHEYGFKEQVTVKEHLRLVKQAFGKPLKSPVWATVKSHSAKANLPERSFLRSALADMKPEIMAGLNKAVGDALK